MKLFTLLFSIILTTPLFAADCGPKPTSKKDVIATYLECPANQAKCLSLKDIKGEIHRLDKSSKMIFKIADAKSRDKMMAIDFDKNSSCWFEQATDKNVGKNLAIVANNKVLAMPTILAKITEGKIQIITNDNEKDSLKICKAIFSKCKQDETKDADVKKGSFQDMISNPPMVSNVEMNKKYGAVMESFYWVTEKENLVVYKTEALENGTSVNVPLITDKFNNNIPLFYGEQGFDSKTKKFIYTDKAIFIATEGWIKREDLVPYNVLGDIALGKKLNIASLTIKKCPDEVNKISKPDELENFMTSQDKFVRSFEVGLCALDGEAECRTYLEAVKKDVESKSCKELLD